MTAVETNRPDTVSREVLLDLMEVSRDANFTVTVPAAKLKMMVAEIARHRSAGVPLASHAVTAYYILAESRCQRAYWGGERPCRDLVGSRCSTCQFAELIGKELPK